MRGFWVFRFWLEIEGYVFKSGFFWVLFFFVGGFFFIRVFVS